MTFEWQFSLGYSSVATTLSIWFLYPPQFSQLLLGLRLRSTCMCVCVCVLWCSHGAAAGLSDNTPLGVRLSVALMLDHQCSASNISTHWLCSSTQTHTHTHTHTLKPATRNACLQWHKLNGSHLLTHTHTHTHTFCSILPGKVKRWVIICSSQLCVTSLTGTQPQYKEIKQQR